MENDVVDVNTFVLSEEQFAEIIAVTEQTNENIQTVNASISHCSVLLAGILLVVLYNVFRRSWRKGGN